MAKDKDDRSLGEKIEDTLTWGTSKEDRERKKKGLPSVEEEQSLFYKGRGYSDRG